MADKKKKPAKPMPMKGEGPVPPKDKAPKDKAKRKAGTQNPFAKKGGLKPPAPMNPGAGSFPPMLGM